MCCKDSSTFNWYVTLFALGHGTLVEVWQDPGRTVELLHVIEELMHKHLIGFFEGVGDVILHLTQ
jgi:hypothetical protein